MSEFFGVEDYAALPIDDAHARDFGKRVLYNAVKRLTTPGEAWSRVELERDVSDGETRRYTAFLAQYQTEPEAMHYALRFATITAIDSEWDPAAVRKLMQFSFPRHTLEMGEDGSVAMVPEEGEQADDSEDEVHDGFISIEYDYQFYIPYGIPDEDNPPKYSKDMGYTILDEDFDPVNGETGYTFGGLLDDVPMEDVERLWQFGEKFADLPRYDKEMAYVTVHDLELILEALRSMRLASATTNVFSKRLREM